MKPWVQGISLKGLTLYITRVSVGLRHNTVKPVPGIKLLIRLRETNPRKYPEGISLGRYGQHYGALRWCHLSIHIILLFCKDKSPLLPKQVVLENCTKTLSKYHLNTFPLTTNVRSLFYYTKQGRHSGRPWVLDPHYFHPARQLECPHYSFPHYFSPTLIGLF